MSEVLLTVEAGDNSAHSFTSASGHSVSLSPLGDWSASLKHKN